MIINPNAYQYVNYPYKFKRKVEKTTEAKKGEKK